MTVLQIYTRRFILLQFLSLHGLGRKQLENNQPSLKATGSASHDKRELILAQYKLDEIKEQINSFKVHTITIVEANLSLEKLEN